MIKSAANEDDDARNECEMLQSLLENWLIDVRSRSGSCQCIRNVETCENIDFPKFYGDLMIKSQFNRLDARSERNTSRASPKIIKRHPIMKWIMPIRPEH